jgi:hypothetical protein
MNNKVIRDAVQVVLSVFNCDFNVLCPVTNGLGKDGNEFPFLSKYLTSSQFVHLEL